MAIYLASGEIADNDIQVQDIITQNIHSLTVTPVSGDASVLV